MDPDPNTAQRPDAPEPPTSPDQPLPRLLVTVGFSTLLLLPLVMYGCGPEWARWDAAQAVIAYDRGDMEQAIFQLTTAVERSPRDPRLKISLAEKLIESGRGKEAEVLCDEILDRFPDNASALITKANSQQAQGHFRAALDTFNLRARQRNWTIGSNAYELNERAYFKALAGVQLEDAREDIDAACLIASRTQFGSLPWRLGLYQRSLVASGIVAMEIGMTESALEHLSPAIDSLRRLLYRSRHELYREIIELTVAAKQLPPDEKVANSKNEFRNVIRISEQTLATLLTVRALAWQQLGRDEYRDQDRAEVREMSLNSDDILAALPELTECVGTLQISVAFLDTRGYIIGQMPTPVAENNRIELSDRTILVSSDFDDALRDLNQSVFAFEVYAKSLETEVHNHAEGNVPDPVAAQKTVGKEKAVLLYHRLVVRQRSGDAEGAAQDAAAIKALGCEPGPHLF